MIYAVHILNQKYVKIGYSFEEDVSIRISQLQTGNPFQIKPLFTTFGTLMQERALHSSLTIAFGRIRMPNPPNEWYRGNSHFFKSFLEYLSYGPDAGLMFLEQYNPSVKQGAKCGTTNVSPNIRWPKD